MSIKDTLLGLAIGDAFGLGIEFKDRYWILKNIDFTKYVNARGEKHGKNILPGFYSDDTEHSIGVLNALMDKRPFSEELLLEKWKEEYGEDEKRKGFPRQGHGSIKDYYTGEKTIGEIRNSQRDRDDPGNAPPMRAVPIGFAPSGKINEYAIINADATHPHPKGRAASILVARATEFILKKDGNQKNIIPYCKQFISDEETKDLLDETNKLPHPNQLNQKGLEKLCGPQPIPFMTKLGEINGLPCASMRTGAASLYVLKHSESAFEALQYSINMGGDIDSLACICTGIMAGKYGLDSLPKFMLEEVEGKEKLEKLAYKFDSKIQ